MTRKSSIKKERVLILDADSSVYAVGFMTETKTHLGIYDGEVVYQGTGKREYNTWLKGFHSPNDVTYDYTLAVEPVPYALSSCKKFVANTLALTGCHRAVILLTKGGDCFRTHRATIQKYKGNRDTLTKPVHYDAVREYYMTYYDAHMYAKWEADDAACMALHKGSGNASIQYIMAAIDKDLYQMPGLHVNPSKAKRDEGVYVVSESEGWRNFYHQMLCGDNADNIKGLKGTKAKPGISVAKANKILDKAGDNIALMCQIVYGEYVVRYGADPFAYAPWWTDLEKFPDNKFYGVKPNVLEGTALSMFRENADLLYMLRTPDDQYLPHCRTLLDMWTPYEDGTVEEFLPKEELDNDQD